MNHLEPKLYITMTVLPERLTSEFFKLVVGGLKQQTLPPDRIIINIPHHCRRNSQAYIIPDWLHSEPSVWINRCEDYGPATKILGCYDLVQPVDRLCVVDDDIVYRKTMLANLYNAHIGQSQSLIATYVDDVYGSPCGFSGYIFQKQYFPVTKDDVKDLLQHCYFVDDTWVAKIAKQKQIAFYGLSKNWQASMNKELTDSHPRWFELCKNTNRDKLVKHCLCGR